MWVECAESEAITGNDQIYRVSQVKKREEGSVKKIQEEKLESKKLVKGTVSRDFLYMFFSLNS